VRQQFDAAAGFMAITLEKWIAPRRFRGATNQDVCQKEVESGLRKMRCASGVCMAQRIFRQE